MTTEEKDKVGNLELKFIHILINVVVTLGILTYIVLWATFQWRNPKSNEMSFFRNFSDIVMMKKLDKFQ